MSTNRAGRFSKPPHSAALPPLRGLLSSVYHDTAFCLLANFPPFWPAIQRPQLQRLERRLHLGHRRQHGCVEDFNVAIVGDVRFGVAQYALYDIFVSAQCKTCWRPKAVFVTEKSRRSETKPVLTLRMLKCETPSIEVSVKLARGQRR